MNRLPEPAPPVELAAVIIARTARLDEEGAAARRDPSRVDAAKTRSDRLAWAAVLVGVAVGVAAQVYGLFGGELTFDFTTSRIGGWTDGLGEVPRVGPVVMVLAAGLLVYLAGLFATVRGTGTPDPPQTG